MFAALERKAVPDNLSFDCAGGDVLLLCLIFPISIFIVGLLETQLFACLRGCCKPRYDLR